MPAGTLPAGVGAAGVATSRLRTNVLRAGPATAPVLVLVHGNVSSARFFAETMAVLGERYHCVAPDLRGFGGSELVLANCGHSLHLEHPAEFESAVTTFLDAHG